jgi:8-oxo-dGTP pyrophosphatase MutT (NUDIX family)
MESLRIIARAEKFREAAVLVPVIERGGLDHLVFERRSPGISQGGEIAFPGGKVDPRLDADSQATARRETCEELGIAPEAIGPARYLGTVIAAMGWCTAAWVARLDPVSPVERTFDTREVEAVILIPLDWFRANPPSRHSVQLELHPYRTDAAGRREELLPVRELGLPERYSEPWGRQRLPVWNFPTDHGPIWGLTAEIIVDLLAELNHEP